MIGLIRPKCRIFRGGHASRTGGTSFILLKLCFVTLFLLMPLAGHSAGYRLQPGDVIEVSVAGAPDLHQRIAVQLDGTIALPLAGQVTAAGATIAEVQQRIQVALASKVLRSYAPDGREQLRTFEPDQISASVVEYRPVFLSGEVMRPGEQPFRPLMTVRQALASAGGTQDARFDTGASEEAARLRAEYARTWVDLAAQHARVWRLKTELGEGASFDNTALPPSPVSGSILQQLLAHEAELRATQEADFAREKEYLRNAIAEADKEIDVLAARHRKEQEGAAADTAWLERMTKLLREGLLTINRVTDARRAVLYSATRELQTATDLMAIRRQRGELAHALEGADDQRRIRLLAELQEASLKLTNAKAGIQGVEEKLRLAGMPIPRGGDAGRLSITLVRTGANGPVMIPAGLNTELQPGDVVEIGHEPLTAALAATRGIPPGMPGPDPQETAITISASQADMTHGPPAATTPEPATTADAPAISKANERGGALVARTPGPPTTASAPPAATTASQEGPSPLPAIPAAASANPVPYPVSARLTQTGTGPGSPASMLELPQNVPRDATASRTAVIGEASPPPPSTKIARLVPLPKPLMSTPSPAFASQATATLPPATLASLLRHGDEMLRIGDIASARLLFRRAAEAGSASAAIAIGKTNDPRFLAQIGAQGIVPDPVAAADWYRRAADLGDRDADRLRSGLKASAAH